MSPSLKRTPSYKLFGRLLLSLNASQKTVVYTKLMFADVLLYSLWALAVLFTNTEQFTNHQAVAQFLCVTTAFAVLLLGVIFLLKHAKEYTKLSLYFLQIFLMLLHTTYLAVLGIYFGQFNIITGVAVGAGCFWVLLLLHRKVAYIFLLLSSLTLFAILTYQYYSHYSYAFIFSNFAASKSLFWFFSYFVLCSIKILSILFLADAVLNIFIDRYKKLSFLSDYDALTELLNRQYMHKVLTEALAQNTQMSLILLDIDHFKKINDEHGHLAGDLVIRTIASLLKNVVRSKDIVGRFNDEEYLIYLPETDIRTAEKIAKDLLAAVSALQIYNKMGEKIQVNASIGVVTSAGYNDIVKKSYHNSTDSPPNPNDDKQFNTAKELQQMIKHLENALHTAKENGRNQVYVASIV